MTVIVDTNVILVANRQHDDASEECMESAIEAFISPLFVGWLLTFEEFTLQKLEWDEWRKLAAKLALLPPSTTLAGRKEIPQC